MLICWLGLKIISAFNSAWGECGGNRAGGSYLWGWHLPGLCRCFPGRRGRMLGGPCRIGERGLSPRTDQGGRDESEISSLFLKSVWTEMLQLLPQKWHYSKPLLRYFDLGRCLGESLRMGNICGYPSAKGVNHLEGSQGSPERKGWAEVLQVRQLSSLLGRKRYFHSRGKKTSLLLLGSILPRERKTRHPFIFTPRNNVLVKYHNTRENWEVTGSHLGKQAALPPLQFFFPWRKGGKYTFSPSHSPAE